MQKNQNHTIPNIKQLRHQAKDLIKSAKSGNPESIERFQNKHPLFLNQNREHIMSQITLAENMGIRSCTITKKAEYIDLYLLQ